jgi:hypothetical protein
MEIERGKRIIITNSIIVDFFSRNENPEILKRSCENILLEYCNIIKEYETNYKRTEGLKTEDNYLLECFKRFEKRQEEFEKNIEEKILKSSELMLDNVSNKINEFILVIERIINLSIDKLNPEKLLRDMNLIIKDLLEQNENKSIEKLENLIENKLRKEIYEPINNLNQKILENILNLPKELDKKEDVIEILKEINKRWDETIINIFRDVKNLEYKINDLVINNINKLNETQEINKTNKNEILNQINNIPFISKTILNEIIKEAENNIFNVKLVVNNLQNEIKDNNNVLKDNSNVLLNLKITSDELKNKIENLTTKTIKDTYTTKIKGSNSENEIFHLLTDKLMSRDGYTIEQVNGISCSCDILIKSNDKPDIRLECKAHGLLNGEKVRYKEVEKFERDLLLTNCHGIFLSLYANIVGKSNFDLNQLSNGKIAIYLSNNQYNIDSILDSMNIIYKIDSIMRNTSNDKNFIINLETMSKIKSAINDSNTKLDSLKSHLKEGLNILNNLTLNTIEKLIIDNEENKEIVKEIYKCTKCNKNYKNKNSLLKHTKKCV